MQHYDITSAVDHTGFLRKVPFLRPFVSGAVSLMRSPRWYFVLIRALLVSAVPIFLFVYHDPNRHFLWTPDADIRFVYEGLLINSGLKNFEPAHVGYGLFFLLAKWFQLLNLLGILEAIDLGSVPPPPASDAVFQELMFWARGLTLILASTLVITLMYIAQTITGSRFYGFLAALAYSGTSSVNNHIVHVRSELPSAVFSYLSILFILLAVKREAGRASSLLFVAASAFCALFSLYSKSSSIPLVLVVPLFPLFFAAVLAPAANGPYKSVGGGYGAVLVALALIAVPFSLGPFLMTMNAGAYFYNGALVLYVVACMAVFGRQRNLSVMEMASGGAAVVLGLAAAQFILLGFDPYSQSVSIANLIEYVSKTAVQTGKESLDTMALIGSIAVKMASNLWLVATESFFNFCWVCRRASIVYLLSLITLGVVWWKYEGGERHRAAFLILSLVFIESVMWIHYFNDFYRMYVEGLLMAITVYYVARISYKSSLAARRVLAGVALVFAAWFWIDDVNRDMMWPTFAPHFGPPLPSLERMPLLADRLEGYVQAEKVWREGLIAGTLPPGTQPWWWVDNRTFIWTDEPWRKWPN